MVNVDPVDLVLEHGPQGNVYDGRNCAVYELEDQFVKLSDRLEEPEGQYFKEVLDDADINYPETDFYTEHIPVYGIDDILVVEQDKVEPALPSIIEQPQKYLNQIRELGLKAAGNDLKLDLGLDNLFLVDDKIGIFDINDPESVWTDEPMSLHLMGAHLLNSIRKLERQEDMYAPELKELAQNWKRSV